MTMTHYIDPDGIVGHIPGCPHAIEGGTLEEGPPPFAASCCIDVDIELDPRLHRVPDEPRKEYKPGPPRRVEAFDGPQEWEPERVEQFLESLGRKAEADDMTPGMVKAIRTWLFDYEGDFAFLLDVRDKLGRRELTDGQAKGVANCWRADIYRRKPKATEAPASALDLSEVPSGHYAVPGGDTRLKVKIDQAGGNWAGWTFVKDGAEYGAQKRYGKQKPGGTYQGEIVEELRLIAADPMAASIAYGKLTGTCGRCGRHLEDEESIANGIGPVCAKKGW